MERQTYRDFIVLIYDNASNDATPSIASQFVRRDSRFHYVRQPFNKGAIPNFIDAMEAAETPYFLWRADDDLTDERYLEVTRNLLRGAPGAKLAVGVIRRLNADGSVKAIYAPPKLFGPELWRVRQLLAYSPPAWFYGMWRRDSLRNDFLHAWRAYPHPWSHDNLVLLPSLVDRQIVWSNETTFIQRRAARQYNFKPCFAPSSFPGEMLKLRRQFFAYCQSVLDGRPLTASQRAALDVIVWLHASARVYKMRRYVREQLRAFFTAGASPKVPAPGNI
jgi:glycosyltransferase involved in cell wall biosynthesis